MAIPFLTNYPMKMMILAKRDTSWEPRLDRARIVTEKGADYFELKDTKGLENKPLRLKASEIKSILPGKWLLVFEVQRGRIYPARLDMRKTVVKTVTKEGKEVEEETLEPVIIPEVDDNADIVYTQNMDKAYKLFTEEDWLDKYKFYIGLLIFGAVIAACMYFIGGALTANASAVHEMAVSVGQLANATQSTRAVATVAGFVP